jgi:hypothetical protein
MDADEFFKIVVVPNYEEAKCRSSDLRCIYNAILSGEFLDEFPPRLEVERRQGFGGVQRIVGLT